MRRRSGAIHCDTIEEFIEIAEAAQNHNGIFYDQKVNRKIRQQITTKNTSPPIPSPRAQTNPQDSTLSRNQFENFEFSPESEQLREELQQLSRSSGFETINVGFLSSSIESGRTWLKRALGVGWQIKENREYLDVQVIKKGELIIKCWVFERQQGFSGLLNLYRNRCQIVYLIDDNKQSLQVQNCVSQLARSRVEALLFSQ